MTKSNPQNAASLRPPVAAAQPGNTAPLPGTAVLGRVHVWHSEELDERMTYRTHMLFSVTMDLGSLFGDRVKYE
jgi:hypothetical protein